jgi:hypothetical protein
MPQFGQLGRDQLRGDEASQRDDNGMPADRVMARLYTKLAALTGAQFRFSTSSVGRGPLALAVMGARGRFDVPGSMVKV